jgi:hypothetical protein
MGVDPCTQITSDRSRHSGGQWYLSVVASSGALKLFPPLGQDSQDSKYSNLPRRSPADQKIISKTPICLDCGEEYINRPSHLQGPSVHSTAPNSAVPRLLAFCSARDTSSFFSHVSISWAELNGNSFSFSFPIGTRPESGQSLSTASFYLLCPFFFLCSGSEKRICIALENRTWDESQCRIGKR